MPLSFWGSPPGSRIGPELGWLHGQTGYSDTVKENKAAQACQVSMAYVSWNSFPQVFPVSPSGSGTDWVDSDIWVGVSVLPHPCCPWGRGVVLSRVPCALLKFLPRESL